MLESMLQWAIQLGTLELIGSFPTKEIFIHQLFKNPRCHHNNGSLHKCRTYEVHKNGGNARVLWEQNLMVFETGVTTVADVYTEEDRALQVPWDGWVRMF